MGTRLYVGNLALGTTEATLAHLFSTSGQVVEIAIPTDRETGKARGFAFVQMSTPQGATAAIEALHGSTVDGQVIKVREAEERKPRPRTGGM